MARFLSSIVLLVCTFSNLLAEETKNLLPANRPIEAVIDHYINLKLKGANVTPAPLANDPTILRRVTLDLVGRIPTKYEVENYLADKSENKKTKLIDRLMASPGFVRHQAQEFYYLLDEEGRNGSLREYLRSCFKENRSWDQIFRELVLPDLTDAKGAKEFLRSRVRDLNQVTNDVSVIFFGVNVSCAQCHNHPHVTDWTQDHFYGMKSFFSRTFDNRGFLAERSYGSVRYTPNKGKPKVAPVMFLTGKTIDPPGMEEPSKEEKKREQELFKRASKKRQPPPRPKFSLRSKLVEISLSSGQNHFFSRALVNRIWYRFLGRGLVMPLDQMHSENPPSHPGLLQWLARDTENHGYDLRRLIRGIVLSDTYARSSHWDKDIYPGEQLFAVAKLRPLSPMQMGASLQLAATDPESFPKEEKEREQRIESIERSGEGLARNFPLPKERFEVSVDEAMLFANNKDLNQRLLGNSLVSRLQQINNLEERAKYAVQTILCRPARMEEVKALANYMQQRQDREESACQQIVWALMTSSEFRFNY